MLKRFICLLLAFSVMTLSSVFVFADEAENPDFNTELLKAISVVDDDTLKDGLLTRGEFAEFTYRLTGLSELPKADNSVIPFSDITKDSKYAPYIKAVKDMNLIAGYSDGTFRENNPVSTIEAITVMIRLLGYSSMAEAKGGYPGGYMYVANDLKLLKNISAGYENEISRNNFFALLKNTLECETLEVISVSDESTEMKNLGITLIEKNFDIYKFEGVVEANDITALYGDAIPIPPAGIVIKDTVILPGEIEANFFLGYYCDVYAIKDSYGDYTLKYICKKENKNNEYNIKADIIKSISNNNVETENYLGETKKYLYNKSAAVIYNGVSTKEYFNMDMIEGKSGNIKLLDNDNDKKADVVFVNIYEDFVVGDIDISKYKIYDKFSNDKSETLNLTKDDPYVLLFDEDGNEISFGKIKRYSVVSIEKAMNDAAQGYIKAYLSNKKAIGKIENVLSEEDGLYITIENQNIRVTDNCYENCSEYIKAGQFVEAGINYSGEIAYIKSVSDEIHFAYLVTAGAENVFEGKINAKLFELDGVFRVYTLSDKIKIDEVVYKNYTNDILKTLNNGAKASLWVNSAPPASYDINSDCYAQVIRYSLNKDGEIDFIDTILNSSSGSDFTVGTKSNMEGTNVLYMKNFGNLNYKSNGRNFASKIIIKTDSDVISVPEITADNYKAEEYYDIVGYKFFNDNYNYNISAFFDGRDGITASLYTVHNSVTDQLFDSEKALSVFAGKTSVFVDGEIKDKLEIIDGGAKTYFYADNETRYDGAANADELRSGDLISYSLNPNGTLKKITLHYSPASDSFNPGAARDTEWTGARRIVKGYMLSVEEDGFRYKITDDISTLYDDSDSEVAAFGAYPIIIYDSSAISDKLRVFAGTYENLLGYDKSGNDCSRFLIQQRYLQTKMVYILK